MVVHPVTVEIDELLAESKENKRLPVSALHPKTCSFSTYCS